MNTTLFYTPNVKKLHFWDLGVANYLQGSMPPNTKIEGELANPHFYHPYVTKTEL